MVRGCGPQDDGLLLERERTRLALAGLCNAPPFAETRLLASRPAGLDLMGPLLNRLGELVPDPFALELSFGVLERETAGQGSFLSPFSFFSLPSVDELDDVDDVEAEETRLLLLPCCPCSFSLSLSEL